MELEIAEAGIVRELIDCQGPPLDIGGYYDPDTEKREKAMRPSATFNTNLENSKTRQQQAQRRGLAYQLKSPKCSPRESCLSA